ncbi:MAG TPA: hypothetical protein VD840_09610 [Sinorhizobium sp.]|nr:hypothetical protein [Sinorhizobium sp.]
MVQNTPGDRRRAGSVPIKKDELPESARDAETAQPLDQGRVPPVRSRDEANVDADEALPSDGEEESIADNPEREEGRFGDVKSPRRD